MGVIKKHPEWIKEAHDLGLKVNVWTVDEAEEMKWLIEQKVDFITTNDRLFYKEELKKINKKSFNKLLSFNIL